MCSLFVTGYMSLICINHTNQQQLMPCARRVQAWMGLQIPCVFPTTLQLVPVKKETGGTAGRTGSLQGQFYCLYFAPELECRKMLLIALKQY